MRRSYLYVPADAPAKLAKVLTRGADAVILDLEDSVAETRKDAARDAAAEWLMSADPGDTEVWVRVNNGPRREAEVTALACAGDALTGFCLAKASSPAEVEDVQRLLTQLGSPAALMPLIETAAGLLASADIARVPRVARLHLGEEDLRAETGISPGPDQRELLWARSKVVFASAATGVDPPVGPVATDIANGEGFDCSSRALLRLGFGARACIHPSQVATVNEVFAPSAEQVEQAGELIARYDAARSQGVGVLRSATGQMVDEAVVRRARRITHQRL
jgi:citrate lyase subunit beta/citryl-CoA lyase